MPLDLMASTSKFPALRFKKQTNFQNEMCENDKFCELYFKNLPIHLVHSEF